MALSASQNSTDRYKASLALDDNKSQDVFSCTLTNQQDQPWWRVDLGRRYVIFAVKIWNIRRKAEFG
jgi:hypothetical protein